MGDQHRTVAYPVLSPSGSPGLAHPVSPPEPCTLSCSVASLPNPAASLQCPPVKYRSADPFLYIPHRKHNVITQNIVVLSPLPSSGDEGRSCMLSCNKCKKILCTSRRTKCFNTESCLRLG